MTIKRVAKSFTDLNTTLKLAVSGAKAPDVVEANQGRPVMGQLVKAGLLRPIDAYADAYGWDDRCSRCCSTSTASRPTASTFGAGNLYGLSQMGEIVGVFYNKDKVAACPQTFGDFEAQAGKAKADGDVPIPFGNLDKFGGIHEYQTVQNQFADKQAMRDFVFARRARRSTRRRTTRRRRSSRSGPKGYFTPDYNGMGYDPAWQQFAKGAGPFLIAGTWLTADLPTRWATRSASS